MSNDTNNIMEIRTGRQLKQFMTTDFRLIDGILEYSGCELLGFYIGFRRFINRKDSNKENEVTYSQKQIANKLKLTNYKYYKYLRECFEVGLIDIEKIATVTFFINYNIEGKENPLVAKKFVYFSTLENINIPLKDNIENLINEYYPEIPSELIKVVSVEHRNSTIIHDYPPNVNLEKHKTFELIKYRDWDKEMDRFKNKVPYTFKNKENIGGVSDNQKEGVSDYQNRGVSNNLNEGVSDNQKHNIISKLNNNINELNNSIINQSNKELDRLTNNIELIIKDNGWKTYEDLVYDLQLEKEFFKYPYCEWIEAVKKAIWEMYTYQETKIKNVSVSQYDVIKKLQNLMSRDIIISTIDKVIEASKMYDIKYPIAFIKTTLFNEIDEFIVKIQAQINYNLYGDSTGTENVSKSNDNKNKFHNFESRTNNYSKEELEDIAENKRKEYYSKVNIDNKINFSSNKNNISLIERYKDTEFERFVFDIKNFYNDATYKSFFEGGIVDMSKEGDNLIIHVKSNFIKMMIETHYLLHLKNMANYLNVSNIKLNVYKMNNIISNFL